VHIAEAPAKLLQLAQQLLVTCRHAHFAVHNVVRELCCPGLAYTCCCIKLSWAQLLPQDLQRNEQQSDCSINKATQVKGSQLYQKHKQLLHIGAMGVYMSSV
jgi:hypothetical protein